MKDLEIKQLAEDLMTAGKPFTNREEHPDNDNIPCIIIDTDTLTSIDDKNYDSKSNSSTVDEVPTCLILSYLIFIIKQPLMIFQ